jgi:heme O synthase-like polyprenyltransferase
MLPLAGRGGLIYLVAMSVAGWYLLYHVTNLMKSASTIMARRVVHASVLYLPAVLAMMMVYKA